MDAVNAIELRAVDMTLDGRGLARPTSELDDIDTLVRTYRARLLRFVVLSVRDTDVAASIVQDCFLKAFRNREHFRGECSVSTWLTTIAVNQIRDYQRIRKYRFWRQAEKTAVDIVDMASCLPAHEPTPEGRVLAKERAQAIARAMDTLSDRQRMVFQLRFSDELELSEIARVTGIPVNTIKTHLHRAIQAVRKQVTTEAK